MNWWGKLIGGGLGFMIGGPLGALLGAVIGHNFDAGLERQRLGGGFAPGQQERVQTAFFTATFAVMGHIAKADGRVSEDEIALARAVMAEMHLDEAQRRAAIDLFGRGKQPGFPLYEVIDQLRRETARRHNLLQMFLEIQLHAAYADGVLHAAERRTLLDIATRLGFSQADFDHIETLVRAQRVFGAEQAPPDHAAVLREAYAVLGVSPNSSDSEVKNAYRRLMNQHHPDKLVAKGLPEQMVRLATEKTHEIRSAYDTIRKARRRDH